MQRPNIVLSQSLLPCSVFFLFYFATSFPPGLIPWCLSPVCHCQLCPLIVLTCVPLPLILIASLFSAQRCAAPEFLPGFRRFQVCCFAVFFVTGSFVLTMTVFLSSLPVCVSILVPFMGSLSLVFSSQSKNKPFFL